MLLQQLPIISSKTIQPDITEWAAEISFKTKFYSDQLGADLIENK